MDKIGDLTTVNSGKVVNFSDCSCEVLGPGYTSHQANMVCLYAPEGIIKVELCYDGTAFYVYRFRGHNQLHHYWSRRYDRSLLDNKKYGKLANAAVLCYNSLFYN